MSQSTYLLTSEQILDVGQKLLELRPVEEVLNSVLEAAATTMRAETAMILLHDKASDSLTVAASRHAGAGEARTLDQISRSLIDECIRDARPVLTESAVEDPRFSGKQSVILQHIQAAVIIPLRGKAGVEGAIYLDSRSDRGLFRNENLEPMATLAAISTLAIENARQYESAQRQIDYLKSEKQGRPYLLVGSSPAMKELNAMINRIAPTDLPVIITGESGTGKELVAREIHNGSSRKDKPFISLYCGNISPELFESELFGHKRGSFTGAVNDKEGLVAAAEGGSLFLDEVGDIPTKHQAKLLRFLQDSQYRIVGDTVIRSANVRIITATNKNLEKEIEAGNFREDLFYRLYILPVIVPPLRDRLSDIPFLVKHFLKKHVGAGGLPSGISAEALRRLMNHTWPGNVRELENTIARAAVVASGARIEAGDILHQQLKAVNIHMKDLSWKAAERSHILKVLSLCEGNKTQAAKELGVSRRYLHYRLKEWEEATDQKEDDG
ncbi:sigma-54-dependent Fis family transcriptional regulator [bacterium]|nr:sigma-54-dependent Fis family transcriptional regulator [bacterium]MBU1920804.1 sigma-54-dependent Fis family transcriptional regulator [bacterium]